MDRIVDFIDNLTQKNEEAAGFSAPDIKGEDELHGFQTTEQPPIPETSSKKPETDLWDEPEEETYVSAEYKHEEREEERDEDEDIYIFSEAPEEEEQEEPEDTWQDNWKTLTQSWMERWEGQRDSWRESWESYKKDDEIDEDDAFTISTFFKGEEQEKGGDESESGFDIGKTFFQALRNILQKKEVIQESQDFFKKNGVSHIKDEDYETFIKNHLKEAE
jgi:hypothetical protein